MVVEAAVGDASVTIALNHFNHCVQRFGSVGEYESMRVSYCDDTCEREAMVEDAISVMRGSHHHVAQLSPRFSRTLRMPYPLRVLSPSRWPLPAGSAAQVRRPRQ